jgi:hypothetical protein
MHRPPPALHVYCQLPPPAQLEAELLSDCCVPVEWLRGRCLGIVRNVVQYKEFLNLAHGWNLTFLHNPI